MSLTYRETMYLLEDLEDGCMMLDPPVPKALASCEPSYDDELLDFVYLQQELWQRREEYENGD